MANFLDDLSVYNAKAALVISQVVADGNTEKANMMSSLKSTANDTTLSEAIRLNALTALINLGSLLDIPLPPYFPLTTTYANTETYVGIHDDLTGLQGGAPGEYYHVTLAERNSIANAATVGDISWANLTGSYTDNLTFAAQFNAKQDALTGPGYVKMVGGVVTYDTSTFLSTISGIAAGGELSGTYPNPTLSNAAVISKVLTGFVGTSLPTPITSADSILSAMQKLNNNIASLIVSPSGVASVALTTNSSGVFTTTTTAQTGIAVLDVSLNTQTASKFLASPTSASGTPTFRAFSSTDLPDSGATAGAYGSSSLIPQITVDAKGRITAISTVAAAAGGQVNSVTLTIPSIFGPVTNTGNASAVNLTYSLATQTANYVWAGPISGAAAVPQFRALVADDIPSLPTSKITGLSSILSGFLTNSLSDGRIWIGNTSNAAVPRVMSGDVTISNLGVTAIGAAKVQYSMIQDVTTQTLLGRYDAVTGPVQQITLSGDFVLNSGTGVLSLASPVAPVVTTKGDLLGHDLTSQARLPSSGIDGDLLIVDGAESLGLKWVTAQGDVEVDTTLLDGTLNITAGAVTLGKMANLAANRIIGNNTGSSDTPLALTGTQVTGMLDQFSTTAKGLVPAASGVNDTTKYLRGDGSWQAITGTGTVTDVSVVNANGFNGSVATSTSTPAITISTTVTGILKGNGTAMSAAVAGTDIVTPGQITQTTGAGSGLTMASSSLLGRTTASPGAIEAISVNSSLTLAATTLSLNLGNGNVFTVQQQMPSLRLNGSTSGFISFTPPAIAGAQGYTLPTAFPGTGTTGYLTSNDAGVLAWASAAGTTTNAVTFNNSGSGDASGTTFNGSAARTISYNTIGAQALNANLTGLSGLTYTSGSPLIRMTTAGAFTLDGATYVTGTATQYAVLVGGAGNTVASLGAGTTTGQLLQYNSGSNNPSWSSVVYPTSTTQDRILFSSSNNVIGQIAVPSDATFLRYTTAGGYSWVSALTSLSLSTGMQGVVGTTGGSTPTLSVSGTLGGLVYFDSTTSWDSTGALDQGELIVGGGSGAPSTIDNGASGTILKSNGTGNNPSWTTAEYPSTTQANRILFSSSNNVVDQIAAPTTASTFLQWNGSSFTWAAAGGGGGSGTVNNGQQFGVAYYPNTGTAVDDITPPSINGGYFLHSNVTASAAVAPEWLASTGSGNVVRATSPSLTTPSLGAATAASINKVAITAPAISATLTIADGSTLATSGAFSTTLTATGATNVTLPTTGTLATLSGTETLSNKTLLEPQVGDGGANGHIHFRKSSGAVGINNYATLFFQEGGGNRRMSVIWDNDGYQSEFKFDATTATKTYTFPNATGTVALIDSTQTLTIPASGLTPGGIALGVPAGSSTVSLVAPATLTGAGVYTLPNAYPTGANQFLTATTGGVMSWVQITGGGDVTGPSSSTAGNFAVFANTGGKTIGESGAASLTTAGRATFNAGVNIGVASSATGTLTFAHTSTGFTTTISQPGTASANATYFWPTSVGTVSNVLTLGASGQLTWSSAGSGDVTRAGTSQVITGSIIYQPNALQVRNAAQDRVVRLQALATGGSVGTWDASFQAASGTVPLLEQSQTFTATQTFSNGISLTTAGTFATAVASTFSGSATFSASAASAASVAITTSSGSATNPQLSIGSSGGTSIQWMSFGAGAANAPTLISAGRSSGTKIVLFTQTGANLDSALGMEAGGMWLSSGGTLRMYASNSTTHAGQFEFSATVRGLNLSAASDATNSMAQLLITSGSTGNMSAISFGALASTGTGAPVSGTTRSSGTKLILASNPVVSGIDTAIGFNSARGMWLCSGGTIDFYAGSPAGTLRATINASGLTLATGTALINGANQVVGARITGYGTPTNGNRTHSFAAVSQAEQVLAQLIADLKTHGLIG